MSKALKSEVSEALRELLHNLVTGNYEAVVDNRLLSVDGLNEAIQLQEQCWGKISMPPEKAFSDVRILLPTPIKAGVKDTYIIVFELWFNNELSDRILEVGCEEMLNNELRLWVIKIV